MILHRRDQDLHVPSGLALNQYRFGGLGQNWLPYQMDSITTIAVENSTALVYLISCFGKSYALILFRKTNICFVTLSGPNIPCDIMSVSRGSAEANTGKKGRGTVIKWLRFSILLNTASIRRPMLYMIS